MVKKFLYFVAICIVLAIAGSIVFKVWGPELQRLAFVPTGDFVEQEPMAENAYQDPSLWYSRPGIGVDDPARWQPAIAETTDASPTPSPENPGAEATLGGDARFRTNGSRPADAPANADVPDFAVFFIHPTSYVNRSNWNAAIGEEEAENIARTYIRGMASPFNKASEIWAPKYRQATMGAFLTDAAEGQQAIDAAYNDVRDAYRYFIDSVDPDTPVVLAGHSQGALHLLRLLREEVKDSAVADRLVAAYVIGWPISVEHDVPALGFAACATPAQTGCILSWSSFAEPADPSSVVETYAASTGYDGQKRGDSTILCTNPLTGSFGGSAPASRNLGTLVPNETMSSGELVPAAVPARCDERGLLLIGDPPEMGPYVLPGNNYHVYDIPLFWANTQADVVKRVRAKTGAAASPVSMPTGSAS